MPERLSGLDATFLYAETESMPMNVAVTAVLDPSTVPGGYTFEKLRDHIAERVPLVAEFRRKLMDVPFRVHHPVWVDDPAYRVEHHIHRTRLDPPGDERTLARFVAEMASRRLDRDRPLWEFWVLEGLAGGRIALTGKVHHCALDGASGADLMPAFFGLEPDPEPIDRTILAPAAPRPGELDLLTWSLTDRVRSTVGGLMALAKTGLATDAVRRRRREGERAGGTPLTGPPTPYNGAITAGRSIAFGRLPLEEIKAIRRATGTKVNDVVLAVAAGALRRHLRSLDALPDQPLVAACPVSVRSTRGQGDTGNVLSVMFVPLHTELDDPVACLEAITADALAAKSEQRLFGAMTLVHLAEMLDPISLGTVMELYSRAGLADRHRPAVNAIVSNVTGPPVPIYLGGARALNLYPMGPVTEGIGVNLTVMSYEDHLDVGLLTATSLVPDAWDVVDELEPAFRALMDATLGDR
ncbi:MAG: wax ester/triacylglycerol synthase family O-acyltransferase [Acidimicrobiales bacterium]|jgi:WS/DGAT/MGAT family acyltransferase|nr:wax ester/triacylglycerol synthase family O-acyltransferase [Acidimicrobiales bacterium]